MRNPISRLFVVALVTGVAVLAFNSTSFAEPAKPDEGYMIRTADGLKLWAKWFEGGQGEKSDTVILVHSYGSQTSKGQWEDLALGLQKEGLSVLMFDLRGHGKSAENRALFDWKEFCANPYNKLALPNGKLDPKLPTQEIKASTFKTGYYPYLINDLLGARRFLDSKNDVQKCNTGRIFIIAEGSIAPLVMLGLSVEYLNPAGATPEGRLLDYPAGNDYAGLIFLSPNNGTPAMGTSIVTNQLQTPAWRRHEFGSDDIPLARRVTVYDRIRERVSMLFLYGKEESASGLVARSWMRQFKVPDNKKEDVATRKYMVELPVEKLSGIKMMDVPVEEKIKKKNAEGVEEEVTIKVPLLQQHIVSFIKGTIANGKNGDIHKKRNVDAAALYAVPLDKLGLKLP